ncbi:MAG: ExeA family protein [Planctomycetota bacterium]|jgi:type II secretory pathway predicted ATPase ExeA
MYEPFFGFNRRPFSTAPDPNCFYAGDSVQSVLDELTTCIERGQGVGLLTAPAGMGKSLLCQRLIASLKGRFATIYLGNANFPTRRSLLQAILLELGDEHSRSDEAELRHTLGKRLQSLRRQHEALLLVVDEAHLFEAELLEEIRTLADITDDGHPLVRIVLAGQLELEERLTERQFDALNQRLSTHVYLEPLTQNESAEFLCHRIDWAGGEVESVFVEAALMIAVRASGGVPRCLNHLADHSLILAFASDERPVGEKTVREALEDLKQLPLHWNDVSDTVSTGSFELEQSPEDEPIASEVGADFEAAFAESGSALSGRDAVPTEPELAESGLPTNDDFVDDLPASTFEWPANPESTTEVEAAWDAVYDFGVQREPAKDESGELEAENPTFLLEDEPVDEAWSRSEVDVAGGELTAAAVPAVIEFGAESAADPSNEFQTASNRRSEQEIVEQDEQGTATSDNAAEAAVLDHQWSAPEDTGEFTVNASAEPATDVVEIFVVDPYSTIEEPLSAGIVWPESELSVRANQSVSECTAPPATAEKLSAHAAPAESETPAAGDTDSVAADASESGGNDETSVIEFAAAGESAADEDSADSDALLTDLVAETASAETSADDIAETETEAPAAESVVFEFSATEEPAVEDRTSDEAPELSESTSPESTVEADEAVALNSLNTMYESNETHLDTEFEAAASNETSEATFEDAETVMSDFGEFEGDVGPDDAGPDDAGPDDADVQVANPVRYLDSIEAMIDEVEYDAEEAGVAVDDQSNLPERSAIDIESELMRQVDQSERDIEDEIGATMLDICLDTQSAIYEMRQQLRESSEARDIVEEQPDGELPQIADVDQSVFDVIEPEVDPPSRQTPDQTANWPLASNEPQRPTQKRAFGSLFSDLRRRRD